MLVLTPQPSNRSLFYPRARIHNGKPKHDKVFNQRKFSTTVPEQPKKSVHFADTKGLALTSTFFFAKEKFTPQDYRGKILANFYKTSQKPNGQCAKLLNFRSPFPAGDLAENLFMNNVCLEKTLCNKNGVYGRIQVRNCGFEKTIFVRYTFDSWQTIHEELANYIPGTSTRTTDTFLFYVQPPRTTEVRKMEFAICYKVNKEEYWDNNYGDNYRLLYLRSQN